MLIHGIQVSLIVGFSGVAIALAIGVVVGSLAGYYGGWIEAVLMRVVDLILILPKLLIALVIVALYGQSLWNIIVAIGITCWAPIARITYAQYLSLKERPFVEAAHAIGTKTRRIILREIMPNAAPSIIVNGSLAVGEIILLEASLSYFGLGDPNLVSLGMMLHWAQEWIYRAWWLALFPGIAIFLIVLAFNLIGDGINDALNPRLKEL
jgi:peptide/nickel transport system permease protein